MGISLLIGYKKALKGLKGAPIDSRPKKHLIPAYANNKLDTKYNLPTSKSRIIS